MSHFFWLLFTAALIFPSSSINAHHAPLGDRARTGSPAKATFLFYISGDTESGDPTDVLYGVYDYYQHLLEVFDIESNVNAVHFNAVILFDGWAKFDWPTLEVYRHGERVRIHELKDENNTVNTVSGPIPSPLSIDMGDPTTLHWLLNQIEEHDLVSDQYYLVFNGHGAAWQGYGFDTDDGKRRSDWKPSASQIEKEDQIDAQTAVLKALEIKLKEGRAPTPAEADTIIEEVISYRDALRLEEEATRKPSYLSSAEISSVFDDFLSNPLPNGNKRFDGWIFSACLMESFELAYEFSEYTDRILGSSLPLPFASPDIEVKLGTSSLSELISEERYFLKYEVKLDYLLSNIDFTPDELMDELVHSSIHLDAKATKSQRSEPQNTFVTWKPQPHAKIDRLHPENKATYEAVVLGVDSNLEISRANLFWIALRETESVSHDHSFSYLFELISKWTPQLTAYFQVHDTDLFEYSALSADINRSNNLVELLRLAQFFLVHDSKDWAEFIDPELVAEIWSTVRGMTHSVSEEVGTLSIRLPSNLFTSDASNWEDQKSHYLRLELRELLTSRDLSDALVQDLESKIRRFRLHGDERARLRSRSRAKILADLASLKISQAEVGWKTFVDSYIQRTHKSKKPNQAYGEFYNDKF